jgi:DNA-binding response OmpR family regulator
MPKHILIVDDDALMRRSLAFSLEEAGYRASNAATAEEALSIARLDPPDLILLDIGLPGMDGLDALKRFKDMVDAQVIFVTARRRNLDEIVGLELGADDYITKPFDPDVLLAHIKAVLRRAETSTVATGIASPILVGDLMLDPAAHTVSIGGKPIELSPREFELLHAFALQPGVVLSVDDLLGQVWGAEFIGEPQVVYVHIRWLREKIEDNPNKPKRIITVHSVGYKLEPQEASQEA